MIIFLLILLNTILFSIYMWARPRLKRVGLYIPDFYIATLILYSAGTVTAVYADGMTSARPVAEMSLTALASGLVGAAFTATMLFRRNPQDYFIRNIVNSTSNELEYFIIRVGLIISASISIIFIMAAFVNNATAAQLSMSAIFDVTSSTSSLRKNITSGEAGYFAPGFVKQFRDILAPIFLVALGVVTSKPNMRSPRGTLVDGRGMLTLGMVGIVLLAMTVAGVRSNILSFFLALYIGATFVTRIKQGNRPIKLGWWRRHRSKALLLVAFLIYVALSALQGRVGNDGSLLAAVSETLANLVERVVLTVPRENARTFDFWGQIGPTYGALWLEDLKSILPGTRASGLSNILHNLNGGSLQGNSPLGLPADVWMAWGWVGLCIVPGIYGICLGYFDNVLSRARSPIFFGIKVVLSIALINIYSPFGFLLYGGGTSVILAILVSFVRSREARNGKTFQSSRPTIRRRALNASSVNRLQVSRNRHD